MRPGIGEGSSVKTSRRKTLGLLAAVPFVSAQTAVPADPPAPAAEKPAKKSRRKAKAENAKPSMFAAPEPAPESEIGDAPEAACAAQTDFLDSAMRLREVEEAYFS